MPVQIGEGWLRFQADEVLAKQFETCRAGGANFLLDVPPDKHGLIPDETVAALTRLRKNVKI